MPLNWSELIGVETTELIKKWNQPSESFRINSGAPPARTMRAPGFGSGVSTCQEFLEGFSITSGRESSS